jgi:uncharacterized protein YhjY with autotransporter beta-barrel domain
MRLTITKNRIINWTGLSLALCTTSPAALAANEAFQNLVFQACSSATANLVARCTESNGGDLSGDSESSLNPSQLLAQNANALQEAKANVRAIREKESGQPGGTNPAVAQTRFDQWGLLVMADTSTLERDASERERGYEVDMTSVKLALDYRYSERSIVGVILGMGETDSTLASYNPSGNFPDFNPAQSGSTESDSTTLSVFFTHYFDDQWYLDVLGNYAKVEYSFARNAIFQVSSRDFALAVDTRGDTDGEQLSFSLGAGYNQAVASWSYGAYGRFDYQDSTIDAYQENGGNGFALAVRELASDQSIATLGARVSNTISTRHGVVIPQAYIELERKFGAGAQRAVVSLIEDTSNNAFNLVGDDPDDTSLRWGINLSTIFTGGVMGFLAYSQDVAVDNIDRFQINGGLRLEF